MFHLSWLQKVKLISVLILWLFCSELQDKQQTCHALFLESDNHSTGTKNSSAAFPAISKEKDKTWFVQIKSPYQRLYCHGFTCFLPNKYPLWNWSVIFFPRLFCVPFTIYFSPLSSAPSMSIHITSTVI